MSDIEPFSAALGSEADYTLFDKYLDTLKPHLDGPVEAGPELSAAEAQRQIRKNLFTFVLATVNCGAWNLSWAMGVTACIIMNCTRCFQLRLFAIKGGKACDCEIVFLERLFDKLGFTNKSACVPNVPASPTCLFWEWRYRRSDGSWYSVCLEQYFSVESMGYFAHCMHVNKVTIRAPSLMRCAAVSAPTDDKEGVPINTRLNETLLAALQDATDRVAKKGLAPSIHWATSEEANRTWREYFDLDPWTLAEMGTKPTSA